MGVPAFYRWLSQKYPKVVVDVIEDEMKVQNGRRMKPDTSKPNPNQMEFDNLYLDMNGIIHPASHPEDRPAPLTEDDMYLAIFDYLERVFACVRPRKLLFMAIDGVAPRAKMNQQRSRRFRSAQEALEKEKEIEKLTAEWQGKGLNVPERSGSSFDSNVITPGTPFMHRLSEYLRCFVHKKLQTDPGWKGIKVILSDASVPGEGEHKIMEFIRLQRTSPGYNPNTRHALHGLDADLIMLALATHEPHFTILRELVTFGGTTAVKCSLCDQAGHEAAACPMLAKEKKGQFDEHAGAQAPLKPFQFLHINILREYLEKEFKSASYECEGGFNLERVIDDFVFMCFFVGNDFLPHLPSLEIREGAIDRLINNYKTSFNEIGGYMTENGEVNLERTEVLLKTIADVEDSILERRREKEEMMDRKRKRRDDDVKAKRTHAEHDSLLQQLMNPDMHHAASRRRLDEPNMVRTGSMSHQDLSMLRLFDKIKAFATDPSQKSLDLASTLSPKERAKAHMYCDELGLGHNTVGEGADRFIQVTKKDGDDDLSPQDLFDKQVKDKMRENSMVDQPDTVNIGLPGYKDRYYREKFDVHSDDDISRTRKEVAFHYVEGLCWVLKYYYCGCASWKWFFPYHYAPFASDLVGVCKNAKVEFELGTPFRPFEQLMGVFPSHSAHALPEQYRKLMSDPDSPIIDYYPTDFKLDLNGKKFAWQAVVLLPFIDETRLKTAIAPLEKTLTEEERLRNTPGSTYLFAGPSLDLYRVMVGLQRTSDVSISIVYGEHEISGFIRWDPTATEQGSMIVPPEFQGTEVEEALDPFECRSARALFKDPEYSPHIPKLLPGVSMPKRVLEATDMPNVETERDFPRRPRDGGYGNGGPRDHGGSGPGQHAHFPRQPFSSHQPLHAAPMLPAHPAGGRYPAPGYGPYAGSSAYPPASYPPHADPYGRGRGAPGGLLGGPYGGAPGGGRGGPYGDPYGGPHARSRGYEARAGLFQTGGAGDAYPQYPSHPGRTGGSQNPYGYPPNPRAYGGGGGGRSYPPDPRAYGGGRGNPHLDPRRR
eukprot:Rmarinus@m.26593